MLIPNVIFNQGNKEMTADIYSMLLNKRIVFVQGEVRDEMANTVVAQLLFLQMDDPTKPITLYINSPGGSVTAGLAIKDTMDYLMSQGTEVHTLGMGSCASMGAFLLASGKKGQRKVLPNTEVMIHQPLGGFQGQATDIMIRAELMAKTKEKLTKYLSDYTYGKVDPATMWDLCERDNFLNAQEALELGLVDEIIDVTGGVSNE